MDKLESIRKEYNDGLYLRSEAINLVTTATGKTRKFAERFLDGYAPSPYVAQGVVKTNLLVLR